MTSKDGPKIQMNGRYPVALVAEAHRYAIKHGLSLNAVTCAAIAEYLARRRSGEVAPEPQLHHERGRPPREAALLSAELIRRDPRGRKLRERDWRVMSVSDEESEEQSQGGLLARAA